MRVVPQKGQLIAGTHLLKQLFKVDSLKIRAGDIGGEEQGIHGRTQTTISLLNALVIRFL